MHHYYYYYYYYSKPKLYRGLQKLFLKSFKLVCFMPLRTINVILSDNKILKIIDLFSLTILCVISIVLLHTALF